MSAIEDLYIICVHQDETLSQPRLRLSLGVLMRCSITRIGNRSTNLQTGCYTMETDHSLEQ